MKNEFVIFAVSSVLSYIVQYNTYVYSIYKLMINYGHAEFIFYLFLELKRK